MNEGRKERKMERALMGGGGRGGGERRRIDVERRRIT
jgi:hypothetical protein